MSAETVLALAAGALLLGGAGLSLSTPGPGSGPLRGGRGSLWVVAAGLCLVGLLLVRGWQSGHFPAFGGLEASSWYALAMAAAYLQVSWRHAAVRPLVALLLPYAALVIGLGFVHASASGAPAVRYQALPVSLHVTAAFAGYGLFTLGSLLAAAYLVQDHCLKHKRAGRLSRSLPSLEQLDRVMKELIGPAFALFTLSIAMGVWLVGMNHWGLRRVADAKVLATGATWLVYAVLFYLRRGADRHGRRLAGVALLGFVGVMLTCFGVGLVTHSFHSFGFGLP
jgi:ABC-type uncharacterized transport system permease subunit